jgi:branched-chain amino acid transport system ATP-binding protein
VSVVLKAENLHTFYGKSHILHGVSIAVEEGELVTLLGRNGAGKTTTLRSLMGLTPARQGKVELFGRDTTHWPAYRISRLGLGYVPEGRKIFPNLTVLENLSVPVGRPGQWTFERIFELFPNLAERRHSWGRQLSGGEQEMLAIARALLINPKILLLDEPSQGLAPLLVREVFRTVASMRKEGISILLVEQNARFGLEVADRVYVMNDGEVVHSGPASELAQDEQQVRALAGAESRAATV